MQKENSEILEEKIRWADAFILLYSVTDPCSFSEINRLKFLISHITSNNSSHKVSRRKHNLSMKLVSYNGVSFWEASEETHSQMVPLSSSLIEMKDKTVAKFFVALY